VFVELADFRLFVNAGLMLFDRDNNNKFVVMLGADSGRMLGAVVGVEYFSTRRNLQRCCRRNCEIQRARNLLGRFEFAICRFAFYG